MKVENLIKVLQENHKPTDDICVLLWGQPEDVSAEDWAEVCLAFDESDGVDIEATEWVADAIAQQVGTEY